MSFRDLLRDTFHTLAAHKLRTALTMFGITWGVISITLMVAAGEPLPLTQEDVRIHGHAIEARIYAEDPHHGFLPSTGTIACFAHPKTGRTVSSALAPAQPLRLLHPMALSKATPPRHGVFAALRSGRRAGVISDPVAPPLRKP